MGENPDFSGWATKAGIECSDGRVIMPDAFAHQDKISVPLVWHHDRSTPGNILGHAVLENRGAEGVYCYAYCNDNQSAQDAKELVKHGDITSFSIFANDLVEKSKKVIHGMIREVSLVLAGANPDAKIDYVGFQHGDDPDDVTYSDTTAIIYTGVPLELYHADGGSSSSTEEKPEDGKTLQEVFNTLTDEQLVVVEHMLETALETGKSAEHSDNGAAQDPPPADKNETPEVLENKEGTPVTGSITHSNVFEKNGSAGEPQGVTTGGTLTHDQMATIVETGKKLGSWKEAVLQHAGEFGITNIEVLFPDAQTIDNKPEWITRRMDWVEGVLNGTRKLPFSKIKSKSADLTHDEARAKGYIKGELKKEQFFEIKSRETGPKTIYKKQKLDRDDIIDITEFDVVAWLWVEMRFMLREEIARAILVGDGREIDDPDKIDETKIRPIATDHSFYTDVVTVPANVNGEALVESVILGRENLLSTNEPTAYMTRKTMNGMLLAKDRVGRRLYRTRAELAAELEVSNIVLVPVMEDAKTDDGDLLMILVNLSDYGVGSTRGGEITTFDQFDIDYNQHKYLIEGRMSGALLKHKTAQVIVRTSGTEVTPDAPTFNATTGVVTIPTKTGVVYKNAETGATLSAGAQSALAVGATLSVDADAADNYYLKAGTLRDWSFTRPAA